MTQLISAFLGVAHIHTPGFIGMLNKRADEIRIKAVTDHDTERGQRRAGELPGSTFVADPQAILDDPEITSVIICAEKVGTAIGHRGGQSRQTHLLRKAARTGR